jgi:hypothetical protein
LNNDSHDRTPNPWYTPTEQFESLTDLTANHICAAFERGRLAYDLHRAGRILYDLLSEELFPDILPLPKLPDRRSDSPPGAASAASMTDGSTSPPRPSDLVTLGQAAAIVRRSKRALENYKTEPAFPEPAVHGGRGRADYYDWRALRPWLESKTGMRLPEVFPTINRHIR